MACRPQLPSFDPVRLCGQALLSGSRIIVASARGFTVRVDVDVLAYSVGTPPAESVVEALKLAAATQLNGMSCSLETALDEHFKGLTGTVE